MHSLYSKREKYSEGKKSVLVLLNPVKMVFTLKPAAALEQLVLEALR
jgi:hypothetical protein